MNVAALLVRARLARTAAGLVRARPALPGLGSLTVAVVALASAALVVALLAIAQRLGPLPALVTFAVFAIPMSSGMTAFAGASARLRREIAQANAYAGKALTLRGQASPIDVDTPRQFGAGGDLSTLAARIAARVALAGAEGRYEPVASVIALDLPLLRAGSNSVRRSQLFAVRFGILTTFAGLMLGLFEITPLVQTLDATARAGAVVSLVREMTTAFGGSVAGLLAATLLQFLAAWVERDEGRLLAAVEQTILSIQSYYFHSFSRDPVIRALHQFNAGISGFDAHLQDGRREILEATDSLKASIRGQDAGLAARLDQLGAGRDALSQLIDSQSLSLRSLEAALRAGSERVAADVKGWVDAQVQLAAARAMEAAADRTQAALLAHAQAVERTIATGTEKAGEALGRLAALLEQSHRIQRLGTRACVALASLVAVGFAAQSFAFVWWVVPFLTSAAK